MINFQKRVFDLVKKIPRGKVTTYKILAHELGNKNLARAVGNALNKNEKLIKIPCHRVIRYNGLIGGYKEGYKKKIDILKKEGIIINKKRLLILKNIYIIFKYYEKMQGMWRAIRRIFV